MKLWFFIVMISAFFVSEASSCCEAKHFLALAIVISTAHFADSEMYE